MRYLFITAWNYAGRDRWKIVLFYLLHSISFCGELIQPYAFGRAINTLQLHGVDDLSGTVRWLGVYVAGFFVFEVCHRSARYFEITTALQNQQRLINHLYGMLYRLPVKWHVDHHSGEVVNRVNVAGQALRDFGFQQYEYLQNVFLSLGPVLILLGISWQIALISLTLTVLNLLVVERMNRTIQPILHLQNEYFHKFTARLIDFVGNIRTIIGLRLHRETGAELNRRFDDYYRENMREHWINQLRCFVISFGGILTQMVVVVYFIWSCKRAGGLVLIGTLVTVMEYFRQMRDAFWKISNTFFETMRWETALRSVDPVLQAAREMALVGSKAELGSWHTVVIRDLSMQYREGEPALQQLSLELNRRSKIAIVGLSGSGKSTLLGILAGLFEPEEVTLTVDGRECAPFGALTNAAILVPQDAEIFENTIRYNLTFGLAAESAALEQAIKVARLREVIERLPAGLDTDIREKGVNLSGGEKQRLGLARGLYFFRQKQILLLDEVTSHLDAFNERLVYQQILATYRERCVLSSVHRLHLLEMFDTVLVMQQGRIVQRGSFAELVNAEGHFRTLWEKYLMGDTGASGTEC